MTLPVIDQAAAPKPKWWFAILWVAAFVAPIAFQPRPLAGLITFVLVDTITTGLLLKPYLPRPAVWIRNTFLILGMIYVIGGLAFTIFMPFLFPIIMILGSLFPIPVGVAGLLVGVSQSSSFVNEGENWAVSRRARSWVWVSVLTWLAIFIVPWLVTGKVIAPGISEDFRAALLGAFSGGVVSCAGILWILYKVPERRENGAAQTPS